VKKVKHVKETKEIRHAKIKKLLGIVQVPLIYGLARKKNARPSMASRLSPISNGLARKKTLAFPSFHTMD
jgi:hypothetical protein